MFRLTVFTECELTARKLFLITQSDPDWDSFINCLGFLLQVWGHYNKPPRLLFNIHILLLLNPPLYQSTSLSIHLPFYYTFLSLGASIQPPAYHFNCLCCKNIFITCPPSLPPSILLLLTLFPLHVSVSIYLTIKFMSAHISYYCWSVALFCLVPVWWCRLMGHSKQDMAGSLYLQPLMFLELH